jgi:hypothetical protein
MGVCNAIKVIQFQFCAEEVIHSGIIIIALFPAAGGGAVILFATDLCGC